MDKHELVYLTLDRLIEQFKASPESFEYMDSERNQSKSFIPTILWHPKVQLTDYAGTIIQDPNNNHAVIVTFNTLNNELTCYIFLKAPPNLYISDAGAKCDSIVSIKRLFEKWRAPYGKFLKLKHLIVNRDIRQENLAYLNKLASVCPDTMDRHILTD